MSKNGMSSPTGPGPAGWHHRMTCRLCDSAAVELVVPLRPTPLAGRYIDRHELENVQPTYPLDLYMCRACGHVQLLDVVEPALIWNDKYTYKSAGTPALVAHFDECVEKIERGYRPPKGAFVVDVGSNDGSLLRCFQKRGFRVLGVDATREIADVATRAGIESLPEYFTSELARAIREKHGAAEVVTAFNVFSHSDDLGDMANAFRELLAPNGVFVFEVSYLLDVVESSLLGTIFHEHLSIHSVEAIIPFLRRHGLELIDAYRVPIQGGSLVGTAQHIGAARPVSPSVAAMVEAEQARGLNRPETIRKAGARMHALGEKVGTLLRQLKQEGKTIAAYGAARSGTTFVAQMGLGDVLSFIVDDDPDKQGKYMAGPNIPVLPTSAIYERRPEYVLFLAWIHTEKILAQNHPYLEQGGRFVLCYPEVQVIDVKNMPTPASGAPSKNMFKDL